jgi:hypothetical protein
LDALSYDDHFDYFVLVASKGSIAKAKSFEEYCDFYSQFRYNGFPLPPDALEEVKKWMEEERQSPFRFESVAPPRELPSFSGTYRAVECEVAGVVILESRFFQVIE